MQPEVQRACPCCGGPISSDVTFQLEDLLSVSLTPQLSDIMDKLVTDYPRPTSIDDLLSFMFALRPDGGPDTARGVLKVGIFKLRQRLDEYGWTIVSISGLTGRPVKRAGSFYKLQPKG